MAGFANAFGPHAPDSTYVEHAFAEQIYDSGEVQLNYVVTGSPERPPLLLIPGQTESWWGYEQALPLLAEHFQAYAVDLRGQGRSTRTPGRYTLDNMGSDLVRFLDDVIGRPAYISGLSSGGVLSAWLSAYAKPGQVIAAVYEDPPLFASETLPAVGHSVRQGVGPLFALFAKYLGNQWSIGDWAGMLANAPTELPAWIAGMVSTFPADAPPQNLREYDPEWGRAFYSGTVGVGCPHHRMLAAVKVPVLFTHHFRHVDDTAGLRLGAISDEQVARVRQLIEGAGQRFDYRSFPTMGHVMHAEDPALFTETVVQWAFGAG